MEEIWKDIQGFEGRYQVSNLGRVRSIDRIDAVGRKKKGQVLKAYKDLKKYTRVYIYLNEGYGQKRPVHQMVARAFVPNPEDKPEINHIDGNKDNNMASNLEWCTSSENTIHAFKNGLATTVGEKHRATKITEEDALFIRNNYKPRDKEYGATALAGKFGLSRATVENIAKGFTWKYLND
ncbi:NUMOD4 motif-containing HNH endonuclease [Bacillus sp. NPDC060175]|uniref:NUMOD4 motif-containing HNH endonuclease n=1 Tax=Bacillus sp. NPDC060175 TaxID=3347061 RepID=UPI0036564F26